MVHGPHAHVVDARRNRSGLDAGDVADRDAGQVRQTGSGSSFDQVSTGTRAILCRDSRWRRSSTTLRARGALVRRGA